MMLLVHMFPGPTIGIGQAAAVLFPREDSLVSPTLNIS